jgi:hypothetical protein
VVLWVNSGSAGIHDHFLRALKAITRANPPVDSRYIVVVMAAPQAYAPSAPGGDPTPLSVDHADARLAKLRELCGRYEIRPDFAAKLRQLESFDIVVLIDDSGSMATAVSVAPTSDPYAQRPTRWSEVQHYCNTVVDLAAALDSDGIDVRFLNRPGFSHVTSMAQVAAAFGPPPTGFTPLSVAVAGILREKAHVIAEKKLLLVIATDGEPTDTEGRVDIPGFTRVLRERPANVYVSIIACTDDEGSVGYLNKLDRVIPRLDVSDDFQSERREVLLAQGASFRFSFGDYVVKSLLGSVDASFDNLDEKKLGGGCCVVA